MWWLTQPVSLAYKWIESVLSLARTAACSSSTGLARGRLPGDQIRVAQAEVAAALTTGALASTAVAAPPG